MSQIDVQNQPSGLNKLPTKIKVARETTTRATQKAKPPHTKLPRPWAFKWSVAVALFAVLGLQGLGLIWLSQERRHDRTMETQVVRIQADIADLRNLVDGNIAEDLIALKILVLNSRVPLQSAREIASAIYRNAIRYDKDPDLMLAMMSIESGFDPTIISKMGAIGLMQVMPQWIDVLDIRCDLKDPDCNIRYGLQILGAYEQLYGGLDMALTAYNRGPGPVDYALMRGKDPDNGYAGKVQTVYNRLRAISRTDPELEVAYSRP